MRKIPKDQLQMASVAMSTEYMTLLAIFILGAAIAILCFGYYTFLTGIILFLGVIAFIYLVMVAAYHLDL